METYVPPTEQLVAEIVVRNIRASTRFYSQLGFRLLRAESDFVELLWEEHRLFLVERSAFPDVEPAMWGTPPVFPCANIRVMVSDVDDYWRRAGEIGARAVQSIGDRAYGLRDFTIVDLDGFGIRFASRLPE